MPSPVQFVLLTALFFYWEIHIIQYLVRIMNYCEANNAWNDKTVERKFFFGCGIGVGIVVLLIITVFRFVMWLA